MTQAGLLRIQARCPCGKLSFSLNAFDPVSPLTSCVITSWGSMETLGGVPIITRCCSAAPISSGSAQMGFPILGRSVLFILDSVSQRALPTSSVTSPKVGDGSEIPGSKVVRRSLPVCPPGPQDSGQVRLPLSPTGATQSTERRSSQLREMFPEVCGSPGKCIRLGATLCAACVAQLEFTRRTDRSKTR